MADLLGIDIGGTKTLGVLIDEQGRTLTEKRISTSQDRDRLLTCLRELADELLPEAPVGIGIPGTVRRSAEIVNAPNLSCLDGLTVQDLAASMGRPVQIGNDAKCAALAEWRYGAGEGVEHFVLVTIGTGIGAGVVIHGELVLGATGLAGEFGHTIVDPGGPDCPCGQRGCWERLASGTALSLAAQRGFREGWLHNTSGGRVTGEDLVAAVRQGSLKAGEALDEYARWAAIGLINIVNALDPDRIVLAGGLVDAIDVLVPCIDGWRSRLWNGFDERVPPPLVPAQLGGQAGAVGAALLGDPSYGALRPPS